MTYLFFFSASTCKEIFDRNVSLNSLTKREPEQNTSSNTDNSEINLSLSIANLRINFHTSFSLDRNHLIEKNFVSFTEFMEAMAFDKFELNFSI